MERSSSLRSVPEQLRPEASVEGNEDDSSHNAAAEALLQPLLAKRNVLYPKHVVPILTRSDSRDGNWSPYLKDLHILSFAFLFIFLAYCAVQNLESSINTDQGLGSASLGVLYLSLTISSIGAPLMVMWLGSKKSLLLGLLGYWAFMGANLYPSWYTLIPTAMFLGFTASVLWVAEGTYLTCAAKNHASACNISEADALGNFNGEFWGIFSLNQVLGNLLALGLLQFGKEADTAAESPPGTSKIFISFLGSLAIGTILIFLLRPQPDTKTLPPVATDQTTISRAVQLGSSFALLSDKKMLLLIFLLFYTGIQQAFIWGDFTKDVITSTLGLSWVGGIMAVYGAADTLGSFVAGRSSSGSFSMSVILAGGSLCQILVMLVLTFRDLGGEGMVDYVIIFVAAVGWGLGDATFNTQISAVLGTFYPHDIEAAFAQWKIWQSAGTSFAFFASSYTNFATKLSMLFFSLLASMGLFFVAMVEFTRAQ